MSCPRVLLINPPIYDFTAYDFWLRPYGLLTAAGWLRGQVEFLWFDHLQTADSAIQARDAWGRGPLRREPAAKPRVYRSIHRRYHRFGRPRQVFRDFLKSLDGPIDQVWVQTGMTYWYPGVWEVIEDVRRVLGAVTVVLGGPYAMICPDHARRSGADVVLDTLDATALWQSLGVKPDPGQPALWEVTGPLTVGVQKISEGCPFACTYCAVPRLYGPFRLRPLRRTLAEYDALVDAGARHIAFYDDALLARSDQGLVGLLEHAHRRGTPVRLHSPNALNARFLNRELARLMVRAGFSSFFLGFESRQAAFHRATGGKVRAEELVAAVEALRAAGVPGSAITAYHLLGHPDTDLQDLAASMGFVADLGIRGMLAEFSPIPGTPDGDRCCRWIDLDEPLCHNKTAFSIWRLGNETVARFKQLQQALNQPVGKPPVKETGPGGACPGDSLRRWA